MKPADPPPPPPAEAESRRRLVRSVLPLWLACIVMPPLAPFSPDAQAVTASSGDYSITLSEPAGGGLRSGSADYTADFSESPGNAGQSMDYGLRTGWSGLIYDIIGLNPAVVPSSVPEDSTAQLTATFSLDDGSTLPLNAQEAAGMVWNIVDGPVINVSESGLIDTRIVHEDTEATVEASLDQGSGSPPVSGTLTFTVEDTHQDNYYGYAGDGLPDDWQIRYFPAPANGSATSHNGDYDRDGVSNFLEYAFGTNPVSSSSGSNTLTYADGVLTGRGQPTPLIANIPNSVDFRVIHSRRRDHSDRELLYRVQFSANLLSWSTSTAIPTVIAQDEEYEAVSVPWPLFINGQKARFFRVLVSSSP